MLRILYCTDYLTAGGVESQTTALITGLDKTKYEPEVLCLYGERAGYSLQFAPYLEEANIPLKLLDLPLSRMGKIRAAAAILRTTWRFRPHIVHAVNYHGNILCSLLRPMMPPRTRLVGASYVESTPRQLLYLRLGWRMTAGIVVNSPHLVDQLHRDAGIPMKKIVHIPNGIDVDRFTTNPDPNLRQRIAADAEQVLVMLTRIVERKAPHLLAEAMGLLKERGQLPENVRAFIVGERHSGAAQQQLDAAIARFHLEDTVLQHPQTDEVVPYYHAADVSVLLALGGEGLPNVVLESLAAGRPIIISEAANRTGVIEDGLTGWVVRTGDAEHLADTLERVLNTSPDERERMAENCRQRVNEYAMEKMVLRHEQLYQRILG